MKTMKVLVTGITAILLGACMVGPLQAATACGATGVAVENDNGSFTYTITLEWDFAGVVVPERVVLTLENLVDCEYYDPDIPIQAKYVQPGLGTSLAAEGCLDVTGAPCEEINWVGRIALEDPDCWVPMIHIAWLNDGDTPDCEPLTADTGEFQFVSYGAPLPVYDYYGAILIRAGDYCIECDYTGPLPDCNMWSPVEAHSWGTIKSLYR
ncbi:MAG: hypothetical protein GF405_03615 [Candidatus Eisenbacteria bacterium]|nr:hypothetical protein [Candidatus Eisenbacteria bacterium]